MTNSFGIFLDMVVFRYKIPFSDPITPKVLLSLQEDEH